MTTDTLHVMKEADETRGDQTAPAAIDTELFLDLEASSSYWIEVGINFRAYTNYTVRLYHSLRYDQTLYEPLMHVYHRSMGAGYTSRYEDMPGSYMHSFLSQAGLATEPYVFNATAENSTLRGLIWYSGRITTNEAGRLGFWWRHWDNGGAAKASTIFAGSWLYATPLDICPI